MEIGASLHQKIKEQRDAILEEDYRRTIGQNTPS